MSDRRLAFTLNGEPVIVAAGPQRVLLDVLREDLALTGTKRGCDIGRCGACLVLLEGEAVNGCLLSAFQVAERAVTTIEGLRDEPAAARVMATLARENAFQCGYCAPGVVVALVGLMRTRVRSDALSDDEIRAAIEGNICRCTGYHSILRAARIAFAELAERVTTAEPAA